MSCEQFLTSLCSKLLITLQNFNQQVSVFRYTIYKATVDLTSKQLLKFRLPLAFVFNKDSVYFLYSFHFLCYSIDSQRIGKISNRKALLSCKQGLIYENTNKTKMFRNRISANKEMHVISDAN